MDRAAIKAVVVEQVVTTLGLDISDPTVTDVVEESVEATLTLLAL